MSIHRLAHVCLFSRDLEATRKFYCEGLGLKVQFTFMRQRKLFGYYLGTGNQTFIEVFARTDAPEFHPSHPIAHFCLEVDNLDLVITRLRMMGIECSPKTMGADHSYQAWLSDPDGIRFELHEYTPQSCQLTGEVCEVNW